MHKTPPGGEGVYRQLNLIGFSCGFPLTVAEVVQCGDRKQSHGASL